MTLTIRIHYYTHWGQRLFIAGPLADHSSINHEGKGIPLHYLGAGSWGITLDIPEGKAKELSYNYYLLDENSGRFDKEWGPRRIISIRKGRFEKLQIRDYWRSRSHPNYALLSSAFTRVLHRRAKNDKVKRKKDAQVLSFRIMAARIPEHCSLCVIGSEPELGNWKESKALLMSSENFPNWEAEIALKGAAREIEYKYGIYDKQAKKIISWENGENRHIRVIPDGSNELFIQQDEIFRHEESNWRASGVALPVFSLRSKDSWGVGDFADLKAFIDWAKASGQKLVQILPINDTVATHSWVDSYPYAAISVFALHPQYLSPEKMGELRDKKFLSVFRREAKALNKLEEIDYEAVMKLKSRFFKLLYDQEKEQLTKNKEFQAFIKENKEWLLPYAVFSFLRDKYEGVNFQEWDKHAVYDAKKIAKYGRPSHENYDDIAVHYFIQYHLHLQLSEASEYAREQGVVLKGDIPIGIYRYSVDAWSAPELYNMDFQAGAPPDDFAIEGQNWGFPTYNWDVMAKDDYAWWRKRLSHMARYFDAYRIDHILGFFRIWQVPYAQIQGLLGVFNPALPYSSDELRYAGLDFEEGRFCKPYITDHVLWEYFGDRAQSVKEEFFQHSPSRPGFYEFKEEFDSQRKLRNFLKGKAQYQEISSGLESLIGEILFHKEENEHPHKYHPRIAVHFTKSYRDLDGHQKQVLNEIYNSYFYHRHDQFWKDQALVKLPAIVDATEMLVCGEDLGMVPDSVPSVMHELGLLSLEIQRMPKETHLEFGHPGTAPYLSVVSPSSHDMSPIRAWWEEDRNQTQAFYNHCLGRQGSAPYYCEPEVGKEMIYQHLHSPSMWAIFPIQDLLAMDGQLRRENPLDERINVPANPQHYWRYRLHLSLEELMAAKDFNSQLKEMLEHSGRNPAY